MTLRLHHVFIHTAVGAPAARDLLDAGLVEGSPNTHPGQGTANRRFFFESGFLSSGREAEALDAWAEWAREYVKVYDQTGLPPTF